MPSLTLAWEYLTGYAVATDPSNRDRAEWPPHPARVFMALAAAWFETEPTEGLSGDWTSEGDALRWMETLGDPEILLPAVEGAFERSNVTFYVPVNDRAGPSAATLQSCPAITRSKQPRTFPRIWVGHDACFLRWSDADSVEQHRSALNRLCRKVNRIGHSSSLVRMWVDDGAHKESPRGERLVANDVGADRQARAISRGTLNMLSERFGEGPRRHHAALAERLAALTAAKKSVTGKGSKDRKAVIDEEVDRLDSELSQTMARSPVRPTIGLWTGYRPADRGSISPSVAESLFDHDVLVLSHVDGPTLPVVSTLAVTKALRETVMSQSGVQPVPDWVSGHLRDGQPLRDGNGHLALIPLPFVGHEHADGHLLGVALAFPRSVAPKERGRVLGALLVDETSAQPKTVALTLGHLGVWKVAKRDWSEWRLALQPEHWTAAPVGAKTWASVTPVVLDRFPKADRRNPAERMMWEGEVRNILRESCTRIGLPEPELIDVDTTCWHLGSPRAVGKRRLLRGPAGSESAADAALGDGYPSFPAKSSNAPRPQVHVWLQFAQPVVGPLLLGAGRYLGYGLCKPCKEVRG